MPFRTQPTFSHVTLLAPGFVLPNWAKTLPHWEMALVPDIINLRGKLVNDLLDSERPFLAKLIALDKVVVKPTMDLPRALPVEERKAMFANIEEIRILHYKFYFHSKILFMIQLYRIFGLSSRRLDCRVSSFNCFSEREILDYSLSSSKVAHRFCFDIDSNLWTTGLQYKQLLGHVDSSLLSLIDS